MANRHKIPRLLGIQEVFDMLGFWENKGAIYTLLDRGTFPKPIQYLKSGPIWIEPQIRQYQRDHEMKENPYSKMRRKGQTEALKDVFRASIELCMKSVGHVPTTYEYRSWARENKAPTYNTIIRHLKSSGLIQDTTWQSALGAFGYSLPERTGPAGPTFTQEECIEALKNCYATLRIAYSMRQYDAWARKHGTPTARQIIRTVGNFNEAKELAGVPTLQSIKDIY